MIAALSRQRSAFGAHVPQKRSGTLRCRTESASEGPVRRAEATTMNMRMVVFRAGVRADEPGSGRVSGEHTLEEQARTSDSNLTARRLPAVSGHPHGRVRISLGHD